MHYRHPRIGFSFDLPDEWHLDTARMSAEGVMVVLSLGDTRLLLQVRRSQGDAAARLNLMKEHLESLRATHIAPCQAPPFGRSRDIVALSFFIARHQQRWISVSQDGCDYTISHTDEWQDVAGAVDRLCGSFVFPAPSHIGNALLSSPAVSMPAWDAIHGANGVDSRNRSSPNGNGARSGRNGVAHPMPASPAGLWQRVSERLRRARVARTQG